MPKHITSTSAQIHINMLDFDTNKFLRDLPRVPLNELPQDDIRCPI